MFVCTESWIPKQQQQQQNIDTTNYINKTFVKDYSYNFTNIFIYN